MEFNMNKLFRYIFIFITILTTLSCEDKIIDPDSANFITVTGSLFNSINEQYPVNPSGITIMLDELTTESAEKGKFIFNKVKKGRHVIKVNAQEYIPYYDTINFNRDTVIQVWLQGKTEDYFPIKENSQIKYKFHYRDDGYDLLCDGIATWYIYSLKIKNNYKIYTAKEVLVYNTNLDLDNWTDRGNKTDTLITDLEIREDEFNRISIQADHFKYWQIFMVTNNDCLSFNRYMDSREGDIIKRNYYGLEVFYKKWTGILKFGFFLDTYELSYELME